MELKRENNYYLQNRVHNQKQQCKSANCSNNSSSYINRSNQNPLQDNNNCTNNINNFLNDPSTNQKNNIDNNTMQKLFQTLGQVINCVNTYIQNNSNNKNSTDIANTIGQTSSNPFTEDGNAINNQDNNPVQMGNEQKNISGFDAANINKLKSQFDSTYNHSEALKNANSGISYDMYRERNSMEGLVSMYKATGDKKYVNNALELSEAYQKAGNDMDADGYLDWKSTTPGQKFNHSHHEWRAASGISDVISAIKTDPNLSEYSNRADNLTSFVDKHIWEKAYNVKGRNGKIQDTTTTHFIGRMGTVAVNMYKATGDPKYREFIETKGKELKDSLKLNSDNTYGFNMTTNGSEMVDVSHAGDTINFMVEAAKAGIVFDKTDMERLANTVKNKTWTGKSFTDLLNGKSSSTYSNVGNNQEGWVKLAEFDPELQQIYMNFVQSQKGEIATNLSGNLARILSYT